MALEQQHQTKQQKYRMVALDLDGTLLGPNHQLSETTVAYLRHLHSKGFIVSIATGRTASCVFEHVCHLDFDYPPNAEGMPMVCANGAHGLRATSLLSSSSSSEYSDIIKESKDDGGEIVESSDWKVHTTELFHLPVPRDVTLKVLQLANQMNIVVQYYLGHEIYANSITEEHFEYTRQYSELTGSHQIHCTDGYKEAMRQGLPSKLLVMTGEEKVHDVAEILLKELEGEAYVVVGSPAWFVEVLKKDVCKGIGLKQLAKLMNVDMEEIIAFGDGYNDLEFLEMAGKGIAMKNAKDPVKDAADEVTEWTNAEDGVIRTLQKMEQEGQLHFPAMK